MRVVVLEAVKQQQAQAVRVVAVMRQPDQATERLAQQIQVAVVVAQEIYLMVALFKAVQAALA